MERALQTAELLRGSLNSAAVEPEPCLQVLLQIADSSITYRSRYRRFCRRNSFFNSCWRMRPTPVRSVFSLRLCCTRSTGCRKATGRSGTSTERELALNASDLVRSARMAGLARRDENRNFRSLKN